MDDALYVELSRVNLAIVDAETQLERIRLLIVQSEDERFDFTEPYQVICNTLRLLKLYRRVVLQQLNARTGDADVPRVMELEPGWLNG